MKNYLIAERYARGLASTVEDNTKLSLITQSLEQLTDLYQNNHDFHSVLSNPSIRTESRIDVLAAISEAGDLQPTVVQLAKVLLRRGRIEILPDIYEVFVAIADERLNQVQATVTTAIPMDTSQTNAIATALNKHSGKDVRMNCNVDPEILGGVVARIGSTVIDGSIRTQLEQLKNALLAEER